MRRIIIIIIRVIIVIIMIFIIVLIIVISFIITSMIIPTAPRIPPDQYPRRGKRRYVMSLVGELLKLLS